MFTYGKVSALPGVRWEENSETHERRYYFHMYHLASYNTNTGQLDFFCDVSNIPKSPELAQDGIEHNETYLIPDGCRGMHWLSKKPIDVEYLKKAGRL